QHRVAALADALAQLAAERLGRRLQAPAVGGELPSMERTAQAVALMAAEGEVRAAVRTGTVEQAPLAAGLPEEHQVLAHDPHRLDRAAGHARIQPRIELIDQGDRLPVAAQQRAAGRARSGSRDQDVLIFPHGISSWVYERGG